MVRADIARAVGYQNISDVRDIEVMQLIQKVIENSSEQFFCRSQEMCKHVVEIVVKADNTK